MDERYDLVTGLQEIEQMLRERSCFVFCVGDRQGEAYMHALGGELAEKYPGAPWFTYVLRMLNESVPWLSLVCFPREIVQERHLREALAALDLAQASRLLGGDAKVVCLAPSMQAQLLWMKTLSDSLPGLELVQVQPEAN